MNLIDMNIIEFQIMKTFAAFVTKEGHIICMFNFYLGTF